MKRIFGKIGIVFLMALVFGVLSCGRAYAEDQYTDNLIPKMTGYTTNGVTVSASSEWSTQYPAWMAFNRAAASPDCWATSNGTTSGWIKVDFGSNSEKVVNKYTIRSRKYSGENGSPKSWTFEGSNDDKVWVILDKRDSETKWNGSIGETMEYTFSNDTKYRYYKINITANMGQPCVTIGQIEMMRKIETATQCSNITLNKTETTINVGGSDQLASTVTPDNATNKTVTWKSDNDGVATVDPNGKITGIKAGKATITVTTTDGSNLSASCVVTVTDVVTPTPTDNTGNATLIITMSNGNIKQYSVSMTVVNDFISWYNNRSSGSNGNPYYKFDKTDSIQSTLKKTEYVIFDKISSFEVDQAQ